MKIAIISVTENGKNLGKNIKTLLSNDLTVTNVSLFHKNVKKAIEYCFDKYDFIIGIMSTGILIRSSCHLLNSKKSDPGIIAIDEKGNYIIGLVSGHIGGANNFSKKIARLIKGAEVITTASEVNGKIAIDTLSEMLYWDIKDTSLILNYNKAILNNKKIIINSNNDINYLNDYLNDLDSNYSSYYYINREFKGRFQVKNNELPEITLEIDVLNHKNINSNYNNIENSKNISSIHTDSTFKTMKIIPKNISVGIGSKKGINKYNIIKAINKACENLNIPFERINRIATGEMKKDEDAINRIATDMNIPLDIISITKLKSFFNDLSRNNALNNNTNTKYDTNTNITINNTSTNNENICYEFKDIDIYSYSDFVMSKFGIPGLCEGVAMVSAKNNSNNSPKKAKLVHRKLAINGVTIAIAVSD